MSETIHEKARLRTAYAARRAARTSSGLAVASEGLLRRVTTCRARSVAAFVPTRGEPGSVAVLDALADRATVLLPITGELGTPLRWARYRGYEQLVRGPLGLRQPPTPDGSTLEDVEVVLVPAVAIGLDGTRLGHGGGFYDRALTGLPRERLVGVVHDDEVADSLPTGAHDVRVGWLCTPSRLQRLL